MRDEIVLLYATGLSCRDVAERLGCNEETVRKHLIRAGTPRRSKSYKKPKQSPTWDEFFGPRTTREGDCLIWTGSRDKTGYGRLGPYKWAPSITFSHRLSWFLAKGAYDLSLRVLHTCDVPSCVNPRHLWLGTQVDNIKDMCAKGRQRSPNLRGEASGASKLTESTVLKMRAMREDRGCAFHVIAKRFGVSTMTAYRAIVGQSWSHL